MTNTTLVTGGAGFNGSALIRFMSSEIARPIIHGDSLYSVSRASSAPPARAWHDAYDLPLQVPGCGARQDPISSSARRGRPGLAPAVA